MTIPLGQRATPPNEAVVLIVEDNPDNLFIALELVRRAGVPHCYGLASGRQLLELIEVEEGPIHLILLDLQLPGEDGYAILTRLRTVPQIQSTRVVALTANVLVEDITLARAAGFNGFIGKPLNYHRFPQQIARILAGEEVWEAR
jgi:two-component system cell cycle response regulator DivK